MFSIDEAIANENNLFTYNSDTQRMEFAYKEDILLEYQQLFTTLFPTLNLDASTPQGQIITGLVQEDLATIANYENEINSFFFGGTGIYLDMWAWNVFRVTRKQGTLSTVLMTITGVPGTIVPTDFTITDGTQNYQPSTEFTIPTSGTIDTTFQATEINDHIASANSINQFVTLVDGVETLDNAAQANEAILKETDNALFTRCVTFGATATNSSFRSILANVAQVEGTSKVTGAENYTDNPVTFKGVELTPHSIAIVVIGGEDEEIAKAIQNSRATGCYMLGNTTVEVIDNDVTYSYTFYRPTEVPLKFRVEVEIDSDSPTNWEETVKNNIVSFVNSLNIASQATQPNTAKYLYRNISGFDINDVQLAKVADTLGYTPIVLNLNEVFTVSTNDIEVVQA